MPQQLLMPRINSVDFLEFPKKAAFHYTQVDNVSTGPATDEYYFRNITKKIAIIHITELDSTVGNPRKLSIPILPFIRSYQVKHRRYRWIRPGEKIPTDENQLVVVNHALCSKTYKYIRSPFSDYNRWYNINATTFTQMGKIAKESGRHQYAIFNLPRQLPSVPRLNMFAVKQTQMMLRTFSDPGSAFILQLWRWLDPATRNLSTLSAIDPTQYDRINLIFEESGQWVMFNLGLLDQWIYSKDRNQITDIPSVEDYSNEIIISETKDFIKIIKNSYLDGENIGFEDFTNQKIKIVPDQIRKRILRALMSLMENRTVDGAGSVVDETHEIIVKDVATTDAVNEQVDEGNTTLAEQKLITLDDDLKQLEVIEKEEEISETIAEVKKNEILIDVVEKSPITVNDFEVVKDPHIIVKDLADKLAKDGLLSGAEHRRMMNINDKSQELESPVAGVKMVDYVKITEEELKVKETIFPDKITILDKEQLKSTLNDFDKNYIEKTLKKETIGMAMATQKAGFVVTDYKIEEHEDILGAQEIHSFKINLVVGKPSTVYFKVPKIKPSGEFISGGNSYRMRKQRTDLPFRKISHDRVQLSSYYGKVFVSRSDKRVNDYSDWLVKSIVDQGAIEGSNLSNVKPGNVFNNLAKTPTAFSGISRFLREFVCQGYKFHFDIKQCYLIYTKELVEKFNSQGYLVFADNGKGKYLLIDNNNTIYSTDGVTEPMVISSFEEFLGLDSFKAPIPYVECRVFGQPIPVGIMLGYYYGLSELIKMLKVIPRRVLVGQRANLQSHEWSLDFADETLIFNKEDKLASLILAGFNDFNKSLKNYSVYKFDNKGVYLSVLEQKKITTRFIKEFDLLDDMFVDSITESLLILMKEPITFRALLVRSAEVLLSDYHPDPLDMDYQTIRGYERVAGAVYSEMVLAVREQRRSLGRANSQISLNPLAVWKRIVTDPAVKITEDINPINNLKEMEAVTFSGVGGRSSRTMNTASRVFHESNKGLISESTSDSSDVGINTYTVPNPSFDSVRGTSKRVSDKDISAATMLSTSANLAVGSDTDDSKRINFIGIQNSHTVACDGYMTLPVRTGYEQVISHRVGEGYCTSAEDDGVIESISETGGVVAYKNGKKEGFQLGKRFSKAGGQTIPHVMTTTFKVGEKFKKGDIVAFNKGWFEPDYFNKGQVLYKAGVLANVALIETPQTHEDACTISEEFSRKLKTGLTKIKKVRLDFKDTITSLIAVGAKVTFETPLLLIQDELTSNIGAFNADTIATLASISQQSPTAKMVGKIEKIEVFYHGEKEDMSDSIRALANYGDKLLLKSFKDQGAKVFTGSVDESYRVDGDPLLVDTLCVLFYITEEVGAGIADKVVFANQMKSIISEVADYEMVSETGVKIDALFGAFSIFKRIVNSAFTIGTTSVLMELGAKEALKLYRGGR